MEILGKSGAGLQLINTVGGNIRGVIQALGSDGGAPSGIDTTRHGIG